MPLSVSDIIEIAEKSQYLAAIDIQKKGLLGGGVDEKLPIMIYTVRKSVDWMQTNDAVRSETAATATITITSVPDDGSNITVTVNDPILGSINLGSYTKVSGDSTVNTLAQSIATELGNNTYNYGISVDENVITIQAAPGRGDDINGGGRLTVSASTTSETAATATVNCNSLTSIAEGTLITVQAEDSEDGFITIGTYTTQSGDGVASTLAGRLAAAITLEGYSAVQSGDNMVVTARSGLGADMNGQDLFLSWPVSGNLTTTFSGGVDGIGIIPNTLTQFSGGIPASDGDENLIKTANYLYWLCGGYALTAQGISGTGSVSPIASAPSAPPPYDFEVTNTSFIIAGQSNKTINAFIGYNIQFYRNGQLQSINNTGGTYYTWNSVTGLITLFGEAQEGEIFQIYPV